MHRTFPNLLASTLHLRTVFSHSLEPSVVLRIGKSSKSCQTNPIYVGQEELTATVNHDSQWEVRPSNASKPQTTLIQKLIQKEGHLTTSLVSIFCFTSQSDKKNSHVSIIRWQVWIIKGQGPIFQYFNQMEDKASDLSGQNSPISDLNGPVRVNSLTATLARQKVLGDRQNIFR